MKVKKQPRIVHPRIECSVPECGRGATCYSPGTRFICGGCWRKAPKELRARYTLWRRRLTSAEKRQDARADAFARRVGMAWQQVFEFLTASGDEVDGDLSPHLAEQLRQAGLL